MTTTRTAPVPGLTFTADNTAFRGALYAAVAYGPAPILWTCEHEHDAVVDATDCAEAELERRGR